MNRKGLSSLPALFIIWILSTSFIKVKIRISSFTDPRDHIYKTVQPGDQTWMAENLAYLPQINSPKSDTWLQDITKSGYFVAEYYGEDMEKAKKIQITQYTVYYLNFQEAFQ